MLQPKRTNSVRCKKVATVAWQRREIKSALVIMVCVDGRGRITASVEAARRALTRHIKRGGKTWIRIFQINRLLNL